MRTTRRALQQTPTAPPRQAQEGLPTSADGIEFVNRRLRITRAESGPGGKRHKRRPPTTPRARRSPLAPLRGLLRRVGAAPARAAMPPPAAETKRGRRRSQHAATTPCAPIVGPPRRRPRRRPQTRWHRSRSDRVPASPCPRDGSTHRAARNNHPCSTRRPEPGARLARPRSSGTVSETPMRVDRSRMGSQPHACNAWRTRRGSQQRAPPGAPQRHASAGRRDV